MQPGCSITLDGGCSPQDSYADLIFLLQSAIILPVFKCSTGQVPIRIERSPLSLQPGYSRTPDGGGVSQTDLVASPLCGLEAGGARQRTMHQALRSKGPLANPHKGLAYKRPPDLPWKPFARHGAWSYKHICRKIPMRI